MAVTMVKMTMPERPPVEPVGSISIGGIVATIATSAPSPSMPMHPTGSAMHLLLRRNVLDRLAQGGRRARGHGISAGGNPQRQERSRKRRYIFAHVLSSSCFVYVAPQNAFTRSSRGGSTRIVAIVPTCDPRHSPAHPGTGRNPEDFEPTCPGVRASLHAAHRTTAAMRESARPARLSIALRHDKLAH